jgi:phage-related protein
MDHAARSQGVFRLAYRHRAIAVEVTGLRHAELDIVGKYAYMPIMAPKTLRIVSWIKAARKDFGDFPKGAQDKAFDALSIVADGGMPDIAKPLSGLGTGVWELAIKERGDAYRVVYALQLGDDIWVVHAFQKKSTKGIATPRHEMDLVRDRIRRLKEMLGD